MTPFEQYLIELGYKRYRKIYNNKTGWKYIQDDKGYSFSTMETGGFDYRYVLNNDFDNEIIWGLREVGKPPTLCWPRPYGIDTDDEINRWLKDKSPEYIYQQIIIPLKP